MAIAAGNFARSVLRNLPWPIRRKILQAPSLKGLSHDPHLDLCVLATPKTHIDAIWSAYTFCQSAGFCPNIMFVVDPKPQLDFRTELDRIFANYQTRACLDFRVNISYPRIFRFCSTFKYGGKFGLILSKTERRILYIDADVLFYREPSELLDNMNLDIPCYAISKGGHEWNSSLLLEYMRDKKMNPIVGFNSGIMFLPAHTVSHIKVEQALSAFDGKDYEFFTEQTLFNIVYACQRSASLDSKSYLVDGKVQNIFSSDVDYDTLAARHFVGPFRHQLYLHGMSSFLRRSVYCES